MSERWVLTAAHCVWRKPPAVFNVTVGKILFTRKKLLIRSVPLLISTGLTMKENKMLLI